MRVFILLLSAFLLTTQVSPVRADIRKQYQKQEERERSIYEKCAAELKSGDLVWIQSSGDAGYHAFVVKGGNIYQITHWFHFKECYYSSQKIQSSSTPLVFGKIGEVIDGRQIEIEDGQLVEYVKRMQLPQASVKVSRFVLTKDYRLIPVN